MRGSATYDSAQANNELTRAWGDFAGELGGVIGGWEWFTTMTFRDDRLAPEATDRCWRLWTHRLNRRCFGVRYTRRRQGLSWIRGTEDHKHRNVTHYHALVGGSMGVLGELNQFDWMEDWNQLAGFARIFPYDDSRDARYYIAKYVAKNGAIDVWTPRQQALRRAAALRVDRMAAAATSC